MSKKYLAIISTDHHLSEGNASTIKDILLEEMEIADKKGIKTHIWLGDVFDNRVSQREVCLSTLHEILEAYDENGHQIILFKSKVISYSFQASSFFYFGGRIGRYADRRGLLLFPAIFH